MVDSPEGLDDVGGDHAGLALLVVDLVVQGACEGVRLRLLLLDGLVVDELLGMLKAALVVVVSRLHRPHLYCPRRCVVVGAQLGKAGRLLSDALGRRLQPAQVSHACRWLRVCEGEAAVVELTRGSFVKVELEQSLLRHGGEGPCAAW